MAQAAKPAGEHLSPARAVEIAVSMIRGDDPMAPEHLKNCSRCADQIAMLVAVIVPERRDIFAALFPKEKE